MHYIARMIGELGARYGEPGAAHALAEIERVATHRLLGYGALKGRRAWYRLEWSERGLQRLCGESYESAYYTCRNGRVLVARNVGNTRADRLDIYGVKQDVDAVWYGMRTAPDCCDESAARHYYELQKWNAKVARVGEGCNPLAPGSSTQRLIDELGDEVSALM